MKLLKWISPLILFITACGTNTTPRPEGYPRVHYPERSYSLLELDGCPMEFEIPNYAVVDKKEMFFDEATEHPCWFNIDFPDFNGTLYFSYKELKQTYTLKKLIEDAHNLTYKHVSKAEGIKPMEMIASEGVYGLFYTITGDAASSTQFFLTDTTNHFIRGSLYFKTQPNSDSLSPIIQFIREDIDHLIQTFRWK